MTKPLSKAHAALRVQASRGLLSTQVRLDDAWCMAVRNLPRGALQAIRRAEVRLARAKAALEQWAGKP